MCGEREKRRESKRLWGEEVGSTMKGERREGSKLKEGK
ncbi:hypothetical protein SLEP1_g51736 [Rubroshorea leprosula]|uniref:Uncharacterized protein n=1 Tax=Rubroshorea leprosula TaxID=152421 RepID=A0AAV5M6Q0_9ROSI|nr:hypothetical protein SLEP1_g51736 [Rubroshorea leprosula]